MTLSIKNFAKFQHFKDRMPPWVKLYRDLLDDPEWHELDPEAAKVLVMLWLIASEDDTKQGTLPDMRKLAFRLRMDQKRLEKLCIKLSHWLEQTDINLISTRNQSDAPERAGEETETETETETDTCAASQRVPAQDSFERFYAAYPKKKNRGDAEKAWRSLKPTYELSERIVSAVLVACRSPDWQKEGGQFVPYPARWLRAKGWEDAIPESGGVVSMPKKYRLHHLGFVEEFSALGGIPGWTPTEFKSIEEYESSNRCAA